MNLKLDCKHFPGDRPCVFNKQEGVMCPECSHYAVAGFRIIVVKLDAVGDVLRTTAILPSLKARYPDSVITWVTRGEAMPLLENNPFVSRALSYNAAETGYCLAVEEFDLLLNMDSSHDSAALASHIHANEKRGFGLNARGNVFPFNPEAEHWLEMGAFDSLKKENARSYQDLMLDLCCLPAHPKDIVLCLSAKEQEAAAEFAHLHRITGNNVIVGLNTGASGRWQLKQWTLEGFEKLIVMLLEKTNAVVFLTGGWLERERNEYLSRIHPQRVVNTGSDNSLRQFFGLVSLCDVFVTGDTLALHAATALKKKVIALFGPTSSAEIDSYDGQITKITADLDCLVCYKTRCDFEPNCMNSITPERFFNEILSAAATIPGKHLS
ncbi:MAG: glycosyltransferase family 9 protein [Ignavibacteriales bacterium]|nr:glycosyltransferase family 9 protein [Ignavibacteriales bacterium]